MSRSRLCGELSAMNEANGISDIEYVAIGNRAGRRQRSSGSWRKHEAVRVINVKAARVAASECGQGVSFNTKRISAGSGDGYQREVESNHE